MESASQSLTIEKLRQLFIYNPVTGILTRRISYGRAIAGTVITGLHVNIYGIDYQTHLICWSAYYGRWPKSGHVIDHKDRIRVNNQIENLRECTKTQNQQNKGGSGSYAKGVTWRDRKSKPWQAKIRVDGERLHLGSFETHDEAASAYREACIKHHGEFACPE